jgi:superfamily II DNA/RNA helicase
MNKQNTNRPSFKGHSSRFSHRSKFKNPSFKGRPSFGARKSFGGRNSFRGRRSFSGSYIDPTKFINKVITTEEVETFKPEHSFGDFLIDQRLKNAIVKKGYASPTPIQDRAIPHILKGSDLVGIANTGTGKTAAFLLPLINKVLTNSNEKVLIIVPTRELALQIEQELKGFVFGMKIHSVCCVGGMYIGRQISSLRSTIISLSVLQEDSKILSIEALLNLLYLKQSFLMKQIECLIWDLSEICVWS